MYSPSSVCCWVARVWRENTLAIVSLFSQRFSVRSMVQICGLWLSIYAILSCSHRSGFHVSIFAQLCALSLDVSSMWNYLFLVATSLPSALSYLCALFFAILTWLLCGWLNPVQHIYFHWKYRAHAVVWLVMSLFSPSFNLLFICWMRRITSLYRKRVNPEYCSSSSRYSEKFTEHASNTSLVEFMCGKHNENNVIIYKTNFHFTMILVRLLLAAFCFDIHINALALTTEIEIFIEIHKEWENCVWVDFSGVHVLWKQV